MLYMRIGGWCNSGYDLPVFDLNLSILKARPLPFEYDYVEYHEIDESGEMTLLQAIDEPAKLKINYN